MLKKPASQLHYVYIILMSKVNRALTNYVTYYIQNIITAKKPIMQFGNLKK